VVWLFFLAGVAAGNPALPSRVAVRGDDTCPAPAQVRGELDLLLAGAAPARPAYDAYILAVPDRVHIDLVSGDGVRLAERDLPRRGSCVELAKASAAIIATWLGVFEAEAPYEAPPVSLPVSSASRPSPAPAALPVVAKPAPPAAPPPEPIGFWITVGLLASRAGGDTVPGAEVAAIVSRARSWLGARASLFATTEHNFPVGPQPGAARWRRAGGGLGPSILAHARGWRFDLHAAAVAAMLSLQGAGLATNVSSRSLDLGVAAGVRLARPWGTAAPWLGVEALYWPGHQEILVNGNDRVGEVPRIELQISLGLSLGSLP
jgi:hypothetical protein